MFSWKTVTIAIYFDSMLATRFFCPSTSKILSNQNRFVAHLLLALSNSPYPRGCVEPFFLKRTYGEYKKTGRQIALSARLLSYGAEGETRTPMKEPSLDPEPSVSTNSTTSAWKGGIPKTFRAGKQKNALSEEISAKTTLPSVFPPDFGSAPPRNRRRHPLSYGEDTGRAGCPPQE